MKRALLGVLCGSLLAMAMPCSAATATSPKPTHIVSLSLCIDQVLLMLVDKPRLAAITHLAPDPAYSFQWRAAKAIAIHNGLAEQIVPLQPDLVIGIDNTDVVATQMMRRLGLSIHTLPPPTTLAEAEQFTRAIGELVGEQARAEQLIKTMHDDIARARAIVEQLPRQLAISYGPNGFTAGKNTLKNDILQAAGYRNLAAELGIEYYGNVTLEQLIWSRPEVIILEQDITNQYSQAQSVTNHPVLQRLFAEQTIRRIPTNHWLCPGPSASKAILALAEQRQ